MADCHLVVVARAQIPKRTSRVFLAELAAVGRRGRRRRRRRSLLRGSLGSGPSAPGLTDPGWGWTPSIAPSGMAFYKGDMFPFLNGHLLVGSLKFKQLYLVVLENGLPARESVMMDGAIGRVRDVAIAYDGSVLLLSDEEEGGLYRIAEAGQ